MDDVTKTGETVVRVFKYARTSIVYYITDPEQKPYMVSGYLIGNGSSKQYRLEHGPSTYWANEIEITDVKNHNFSL